MKRVKQIMAGALSGAMLLGCGWTAGSGSVKAAEDAAVSGTVYSIYRAFTENGRDTDPEFGTRSGSLNSSLSPRVIELQYQDNPEEMRKAGIDFAIRQIRDLRERGVDGVHIYTMNHADVAKDICGAL